jgi:hypothetical protein
MVAMIHDLNRTHFAASWSLSFIPRAPNDDGGTMDGGRAVLLDVSDALYDAAERLPPGSPWIDAFCKVAQVVESDAEARRLPARERLRRRGIKARARLSAVPVGARVPDPKYEPPPIQVYALRETLTGPIR